jgi:hypothetical protein
MLFVKKKKFMKIFTAIFFLLLVFNTHAEEGMLKFDIARGDAHLPLYRVCA